MGTFYWSIVGVYLTIGIGVLIVNARPHAQERAVLKLAQSVGIPLPERLGDTIRRRILSSRRGNVVGGMVGVVLSTWAIASEMPSEQFVLGPVVVVGGALAGSAVGISIAAILSARRGSDNRVRYARALAVKLDDYVSSTERWLARGSGALAVVSLIAGTVCVSLGWANYASNWSIVRSIAFALIVTAALAVFEVAGRRIVAMGNHAGSPEELVWEDATRSLALRDVASAPAFLGLYGILLGNIGLATGGPNAGSPGIAVVAAGLGVATVLIAVVMLVAALQPQRYFLRRLWPELAARAGNPQLVETEA